MMWDSVLSDKPLIAAPRELDRPLVLSHSRGLQSKGFSSQSLESSGGGGFGLQSCLESCAKLPPNLRKILESSVGVGRKLTFSVIASRLVGTAIHKQKVDSMDCHDFASAKSRNDGGLFFQQDSRSCGNKKNAENVFFNHAQRRKDFEARIGVLQGERGDKTSGLSHKRAAAIHDSSPKAKRPNQTKEIKWN